MKKLLIGMLISTMCFTASADGLKTIAKHKEVREVKGINPSGIIHRELPSNFNNPGYTGIPKPHTPRKQANPIQKNYLTKEPEGTINNLQPK